MIPVSATYNSIIEDYGGQYEWRIINGTVSGQTYTGTEWDITHLMSGTISAAQFGQLSIGNCIAAQVDLQLWNVSPDTEKPIIVQFRANYEGTVSDWYTKGVFFIDTVESSPYSEVTHITGFDAMLKAEVVYLKTGTWNGPTTYQVLTRIASDLGVPIEGNTDSLISSDPITMSATPSLGENGTTDREMLSYIGAMYGGNFVIDHDGELKLIVIDPTPDDIADVGDAVDAFDASPGETVTRVRVWLDSNTYFAFPNLPLTTHDGDPITDHNGEPITIKANERIDEWAEIGGYCLEVDLPLYASYEVAERIYTQLNGLVHQPYVAQKAYVDPKYELGDGVLIKDITSLIASQIINIDPLAPSDLELKGEEIIQSYYPYISPIEKEVARVEQRSQASIQITENRIESAVTEITDNISGTASVLQSAIDAANGEISGLQTRASTLAQDVDGFTATLTTTVSNLQDYADGAVADGITEYSNTVTQYLEYKNGELRLGNNIDGFKTILSNTELGFYQGDNKVAYISNNKLYITNAEITDNLQIGKYQWITDSTGRMSLKWVG